MLTLQETLIQQNNLEQLCADRPLKTSEIFTPNAFYGIDTILKCYTGLPQTYSLKVVVPHGVVWNENHIWEAEKAALLPVVFCSPPYREFIYANQTGKRAILSASPFLYVVEILKNQPQPTRRGTIFFPSHSTYIETVWMDFEGLAERLMQLGDEYKPITVCIYCRDFNLGYHVPFQKRGLKIVSAGHIFDPDFLFRFYHLCSIHRYSASNSFGSHIWYSIKAGCSYFYIDKFEVSILTEKDGTPPLPSAKIAALKSLFSKSEPFMTTEQLKTADYYLGADYFKSPAELRWQFLYAEILDKAGFYVRNRGRTGNFVVPTYYRRCGLMWKHRLLKIMRKLLGLCGRIMKNG